jgi:hypothetical protein
MGHSFDRALWLHGSTKPAHPRNKEETMYTPRQIWHHVTPKAQLLIALALATALAFSVGLASGLYGRTLYTFLTTNRAVTAPAAAPMTASNQAAPLGIDLPAGAQRSDLPTGLTDYLRPGNATSTIGMQSHPLGIDLPRGADVHDLPRGLTDYLRPQRLAVEAPVAGAGSAYDGSAYVEYLTGRSAAHNPNVPISGAGSAYDGKHFDGVTAPAVALDQAQQSVMDYVRAHDAVEGQQAPATVTPNVPAIGTGSAYDGGHYGSPVSAPQTSPNVPIRGTGSAYNGQ